jgi:hypothetical protein
MRKKKEIQAHEAILVQAIWSISPDGPGSYARRVSAVAAHNNQPRFLFIFTKKVVHGLDYRKSEVVRAPG